MLDFDDYVKEVSANYWVEEDEMKLGIHPTQVKERIEKCLVEMKVEYDEITFLDWSVDGARVKVSLDDKVYGIFNYTENYFEN